MAWRRCCFAYRHFINTWFILKPKNSNTSCHWVHCFVQTPSEWNGVEHCKWNVVYRMRCTYTMHLRCKGVRAFSWKVWQCTSTSEHFTKWNVMHCAAQRQWGTSCKCIACEMHRRCKAKKWSVTLKVVHAVQRSGRGYKVRGYWSSMPCGSLLYICKCTCICKFIRKFIIQPLLCMYTSGFLRYKCI